jgi:alanyl-tRNA synthetase
LRRILRRAVLFSGKLKLPRGSFVKLLEPAIAKLGPVFPELVTQKEMIASVIASEEEAFEATIDRGLALFDKITAKSTSVISGKDAFTLYDTYGFPIDLTQIVARERNFEIDLDGFHKEMEIQRRRARAAQKKSVIEVVEGVDAEGSFVGFSQENLHAFESEVLDVITGTGGETYLACAETPFYAEMGGQIGDTGHIEIDGAVIPVVDTIRDTAGHVLHHIGNVAGGEDREWQGKGARLSVDRTRRQAIQCHHTATHILHWALRQVLGSHVHQAGSLVTDERLRFDFSHFEQPGKEQLAEIESLANERILSNSEVAWYETAFDQKPADVIAFFGDKYGDIVRVVDIGGWSVELCGGTHVDATGEIGLLKLTGESAIATGTRRVEAVVAASAQRIVAENFDLVSNLAGKLSCPPEELERRFDTLLKRGQELEKMLREVRRKDTAGQADDLARQARQIDGLPWVSAVVEASNPDEMRNLAIATSRELGEGVVVIGAVFGEKVSFLALASPGAVKQGVRAGDIIKRIAPDLGGRGGGKPDFAMGGGTAVEKLASVIEGVLNPPT